jgi:hypothetical protein
MKNIIKIYLFVLIILCFLFIKGVFYLKIFSIVLIVLWTICLFDQVKKYKSLENDKKVIQFYREK